MAVSINPRSPAINGPSPAAADQYGYSTSLSADGLIMVVGEPEQDDVAAGNITNSGAVYTYFWISGAWEQQGAALNSSDFSAGIKFGSAVAISGDGLVLVVSAPFQGAGQEGYIYTYDWSGGVWVQRGSAFTRAADPDVPYRFGQSLSLSNTGAVLAVGDRNHYDSTKTTLNNIGAAYIYDVSGATWVQRGSKLLPATYANNNLYGYAVSISSNGLVLSVGTLNEDGGNVGKVYVYDWNGSAWVLRGTLVSADSTRLYVGHIVGLSSDGVWMLVGSFTSTETTPDNRIYIYKWNGSAWLLEGFRIVLDSSAAGSMSANALVVSMGQADETVGAVSQAGQVTVYDVVPPPEGTIVGATTLTVVLPPNIIAGPTALTVTNRAGVIVANTTVYVNALGTITASTALAVVPPGEVLSWTARCVLAGVDISAQLTGTASVQADEGAARVATVSIKPPSGVVVPLDYVGKFITLDYVQVIGAAQIARRVFTGWVDAPDYDPNSTILTLTCVDDLQNRVAKLPRSVIDSLVGGRYTEAVQGEILDNWDYAQARLSTVAASLDADAAGGLRLTAWELATSWATYDQTRLIYLQSVITYPQRSTLINKVDIEFEYRYPRLRQRYTTMGWSGTQIDMAPCGWLYPTAQDILGAAGGTDWTPVLGIFYPAPATIPHSSGGYIVPAEGSVDMAIVHLTHRHTQTVSEEYTLTVRAPESIALNGELIHELRAGLASDFSTEAWESALDVLPLMPTGGEQDYAPDAPRSDADYAINTLLDQGRAKILGSHRSARVSNAILLNPDLDLDKRVSIATAGMNASGKVATLTHVMDFSEGSATTEFSIACFGLGGAGLITPSTLTPPVPPAPAVDTQNWSVGIPPLFVNTFGVTPYSENLMGLVINPPETVFVHDVPGPNGPESTSLPNPSYVAGSYPVQGFRLRMPGVDDANRNPVIKPVTSDYQLILPSDPITFTVP